MIETKLIDIALLSLNEGQIEGLPPNPRFIKDAGFKSLVKSLKEDPDMLEMREVLAFPFNGKYVVIGGNMRLRAGLELGLKEMPVKVLPADTSVEKLKRITIKDNGSWGSHDWEALANEWGNEPLADWGIELPDGWGQNLEAETAEEGEFDGSLPPEPVTVLGDLYELNGHRLQCADSTDSLAIERLMDGKEPSMVFTDPPFDMAYGDMLAIFGYYPSLFQIWVLDDNSAVRLASDNIDCLFTVMVYVAKNSLLTNNRQPIRVHCLMPVFNYHNSHTDLVNYTTVHEYGRNLSFVGQTGASHSKPTQLFDQTLRNFLKPGEIVADWFAHSGSVLIAAEQESRLCYCQELEAKYCDLVVRRWVKFMQDNNRPYTVKRNGVTLTHEELNQY